ncbi:phytoene/squalene synthase family protein [Nocardia camponoti]|uniref:Phytoene synthase n=1 Tax=Nocardia camponoti TaxID=1616106 RepID=A0A917QT96_9NOCA|nr:phytoene/squalene synthase family protein [Nocardia camponoti]GGK66330.1 hypothetical protein GCM10011591_43060 [Nocardia camponoti]
MSDLDTAYALCGRIAAEHGRTYYLATRLLRPEQRRAVHALYAFARMVDDVVDHADNPGHVLDPIESRRGATTFGPKVATLAPHALVAELDEIERLLAEALAAVDARPADVQSSDAAQRTFPAANWTDRQRVGSHNQRGAADTRIVHAEGSPIRRTESNQRDLIIAALADTIATYHLDPRHLTTFLDAMRMDIPGSPTFRARYATMGDLREYMAGSAAAIGLVLLPVLGTVGPRADAEPAAAALGEAFQLTNFLRDLGEDLDRGRVYLPADELAAFGVDEARLFACREQGKVDGPLRRALAHLIAVNRDFYRRAAPGVDALDPRVRPAIRTASVLYAEILDQIESADYEVFARRAVVGTRRRVLVASAALVRSRSPRRT